MRFQPLGKQSPVTTGLSLDGYVTMFTEVRPPIGTWGLSRRIPIQAARLPIKELDLDTVPKVASYVATRLLRADILSVRYGVVRQAP